MPMAIYSGLTVQQKGMRRLGGQAGALPQGWHGAGPALASPARCKAKAMGFWGQALHGGDLWVSILPAQDVAQRHTRHSAVHQLKHSWVISSGLLLPNLLWLTQSWGDRASLNPSWPCTEPRAVSTLIPSARIFSVYHLDFSNKAPSPHWG